jgi:excisionase family DNA binding protein
MSTTAQRPEFLSVRELGDYLRVSLRTAYQLVYDGAVPAVKIGGQYRIPRAELDRQIAERIGESGHEMREPGFDRAQGSREDEHGQDNPQR